MPSKRDQATLSRAMRIMARMRWQKPEWKNRQTRHETAMKLARESAKVRRQRKLEKEAALVAAPTTTETI